MPHDQQQHLFRQLLLSVVDRPASFNKLPQPRLGLDRVLRRLSPWTANSFSCAPLRSSWENQLKKRVRANAIYTVAGNHLTELQRPGLVRRSTLLQQLGLLLPQRLHLLR